MSDSKLFYLMQIAGGTFPSGGFTQSCGLETYVSNGKVRDEDSFRDFLYTYLGSTISSCEGPVVCRAYELASSDDMEDMMTLEELSTASKVTKESRESSLRMGKAFLRIAAEIIDDSYLTGLFRIYKTDGISYPVAYGAVCRRLDIPLKDSVEAFVFGAVNILAQSAVKLIPLGNTQAQKILMDIRPQMTQAAEKSMMTPVEEMTNFAPGLDIASIQHENLPVRLYMS